MKKFKVVFKDINQPDIEIKAEGYGYQFTRGDPHVFFDFYAIDSKNIREKWADGLYCSINVDSVLYIQMING